MTIGQAPNLYADQETRQIVAVYRGGDSGTVYYYEYLDGEFVEIY